ncbi:MAG: hypothetical protein HOQ45_02265 [Nocardioidaceae bacterium]|nr:hypothetical protein [Nocardioidaceae bacterium]
MHTVVIQVEGELGDHLSDTFPGLVSQCRLATTITGRVEDGEELQGVLNYLASLGHSIRIVATVPEEPSR